MDYIKYNWEHLKNEASEKRFVWMRVNYKNPISEDEFVQEMQKIRGYGQRGRNYSPNRLKSQYKKLKSIYGFFKT